MDLGKTKLYFEFHDKEINLEIWIGNFIFSFFSTVFSAAKGRDRIGKDKGIGKWVSDVSVLVFLEEI